MAIWLESQIFEENERFNNKESNGLAIGLNITLKILQYIFRIDLAMEKC